MSLSTRDCSVPDSTALSMWSLNAVMSKKINTRLATIMWNKDDYVKYGCYQWSAENIKNIWSIQISVQNNNFPKGYSQEFSLLLSY